MNELTEQVHKLQRMVGKDIIYYLSAIILGLEMTQSTFFEALSFEIETDKSAVDADTLSRYSRTIKKAKKGQANDTIEYGFSYELISNEKFLPAITSICESRITDPSLTHEARERIKEKYEKAIVPILNFLPCFILYPQLYEAISSFKYNGIIEYNIVNGFLMGTWPRNTTEKGPAENGEGSTQNNTALTFAEADQLRNALKRCSHKYWGKIYAIKDDDPMVKLIDPKKYFGGIF